MHINIPPRRGGGTGGGRGHSALHIPGYVGGRGTNSHRHLPRQSSSLPKPLAPPPRQQVQQRKRQSRMQPAKQEDSIIWGEITILSVGDIICAGLTYVHFGKDRQDTVNLDENKERFRDHYGVPADAALPMFNDLKDKYPKIRFKYILMAMHWLKVYGTERQMSGTWGYGDLKHIRETVKDHVRKIASLEKDKIVFGGFDDGEIYVIGLDGVHFRTQEFRLNPSTAWFDFKSASPGLAYLFAMAISRPAIVFNSGPYPASVHDINIFRGGKSDQDKKDWEQDSLYFRMDELGQGKKGVGDSGFAGEPDKVVTTKTYQSKDFKEFLARVKNRQESLHIRLQAFNVLENRFRHGKSTEDKKELHGLCVSAILVMVQYDFETTRPPFMVR